MVGKGKRKLNERQRVRRGHVWWRRRVAEEERRVRGRRARGIGTDTNADQGTYRKRGGWKQNGERNGMREVEWTERESGRDRLCAGQSGIPAQTGGLHITETEGTPQCRRPPPLRPCRAAAEV